jgi:hypothetical protein
MPASGYRPEQGRRIVAAMANIFTKKSPLAKLEKSLDSLRTREAALSLKRSNAQILFDEAVSERQEHLLSGDIDDAPKMEKLQDRCDSTGSMLAGIIAALEALASQIDTAERALMAERETVERQAASEKLAVEVAAVQESLPRFLDGARELHGALMAVGGRTFEVGQLAQFLLGAMGQIEVAAAFSIDELKRMAEAIKVGHAPVPRVAAEVVQLPQPTGPSPTDFGEEMQDDWYTLRAVTWKTLDGRKQFAQAFEDISLPTRLIARAQAKGCIIPRSDPRRKETHGALSGHYAANSVDLDASDIIAQSLTDLPEGFERLPTKPSRTLAISVPRT